MAKAARPMTDNELIAVIAQLEKNALGSNVVSGPTVSGNVIPAGQQMTTLEIDRYNALNAYMARPLGNEQEGRSQVVMPELRDTIEWVMPQLMRMFVASKSVVRFQAENASDEPQADLESEVVNYVFCTQNDGFFVLHDMFKDALLLRNGYAKVYAEKETKTDVERYTGLTAIELQMLMDAEPDDEIEVLEQRETVQAVTGAPQMPGQPPDAAFDIKLRRTRKINRVRVEAVPPEETLISPQARKGLEDCGFVEHKTTETRSKLCEMGYDRATIDAIAISHPSWLNLVALARNEVVDQLSEDSDTSDRSTQEVDFRVVELNVDYDGDGIAELRRVIMGGEKILDNDEISEGSMVSCSPIRMPHRHIGISYYDLLNDLQAIKTALFREGLDNLYLANNSRTAIDRDKVNISDLLISRPGGVIRCEGPPSASIMPFPVNPGVLGQVIPALEYVDSLREMRTGIGKDTMGVDADALQDVTKGGQLAAMSAAAMKVELVARLLAEGVKDLFLKIHSELRRNQNKAMTVRIAGRWVDVNPSEWGPRSNVTVNVGLGSGTRQEERANFMMLGQMQEKIAQLGLVGPQQAYATFKRGAEIMGIENPEQYAMDPDSPQYQQFQQQHRPPPNPMVQVAQIRAQTEQAKLQATQQGDAARLQSELAQAQASEQTVRVKSAAELAHAQQQLGQAHQQSQMQMDTTLATTLINVIGKIVAQQLSQNAAPNAGQVLADDVRTAEGGLA